MLDLFQYNWQVREEWFKWCETIPSEELMKKRTGGMGSIIHNLFHVIDCEQLWVNQMQGTTVINKDIDTISSLSDVKTFSNITKLVTKRFIESYALDSDERILEVKSKNGNSFSFTYEKIMRHIITHEIHHIGQLSVWSREMSIKPVSSDLLTRDYLRI
ncbi:DinB family protein [Bacillus sp. DX1.1]|uniref:DinB family protein n=1 Tax=unclassified Bacillus (in: firmicutes) TaxID=185979 RepID=UPI00257018FF|nr:MULTISPECIES: DinB family protein [unclassified Bacillus (in: firmicutes)]MDM5155135.1 DinB family protein [Bacillus sp. DX1.1]WJE79463.1 DinB family protein [Bacillus sp. DX3.1]